MSSGSDDGRIDSDIESDTPIETEIIDGEPQENEQEQEQSDKTGDNEQDQKKIVKPKRIIKNPQPKFNEHTIKSAKGLSAIRDHFKNIKFKGKGYEDKDLNTILKTYEYWSHRFFPKYTFDDSIERLEVLGNKKGTKTYLNRIRMGLEEFVEDDKPLVDEEIPTEGFVEPFDDKFDQLLQKEPEPELTEEQLETIRQNRLRAEAIRRERLSRINQNQTQTTQNTEMDIETNQIDDENEEINIENALGLLNDDVVETQKTTDEIISDSIRKERFKSLLNDESDDDNSKTLIEEENDVVLNKSNKKNRIIDSDDESNDSDLISTQNSGSNNKVIENNNTMSDEENDANSGNTITKKESNRFLIESDESNDGLNKGSESSAKPLKRKYAILSDDDDD